jgi:hypothetical protein
MTTPQLSQQDYRMDLSDLKDLIPLFIMGATTLGGAVAWMMGRMDSKSDKLEKFFAKQINDLQMEVHSQNEEINQLRSELSVYVRHVGVLEGLLKSKGIEPPPFSVPGK